MTTYHDWNDAIITYVTQGLNIGAQVFLSIDSEMLEMIGLTFGERPIGGWSEDFIRAVRNHCTYENAVNLSRFTNPSLRDSQNRPRYVAFLAAMVLAAHDMGEEDTERTVDPREFYTHFNSILGLSNQQDRPKGLRGSDEDKKLWEDWSAWLRSQGFTPTARSSTDGPQKYIGYPISQALLRQSDKNKLWRHFTNNKWRKNYDEVLLMQRIRRDAQYLTNHLQEILDTKRGLGLRSYEAIGRACYEVYEEWREAGGVEIDKPGVEPRVRTSLDARIYRTEDFFSGDMEYRIFPRQTRQVIPAKLEIEFEGQTYPLSEERPGWYIPLWTLDGEQLNNGLKIPVISHNSPINMLFLPARDFWVLTLDPDTPESGIYASWDKGIELGAEFILLVRDNIKSDLAKLNDEDLLSWQSVTPIFDGWHEYRGVTVQLEPQAWASMNLENDSLRLTLQPRTAFSINFVGGLRAPRGYGWFHGYGPKLALASFLPDAELAVFDISGFDESQDPIYTDNIGAGQLIEIPWDRIGTYRVVVNQNGQYDEKIVRIVDWDEINSKPLDFQQTAHDFKLTIYGAIAGNE